MKTLEKMRKIRRTTSSRQRQRYDDDCPIPLDLIIEILTRLPVKTLVRFQSVSKLWSSIIRSWDFRMLFLAQSSTRPSRPLLTIISGSDDVCIYSSRQLPNPGEQSSSVANLLLTIPRRMDAYSMVEVTSLSGLIYFIEVDRQIIICNPSTKQLITLPLGEPNYRRRYQMSYPFFGYDAVDDQHKVLCTSVGDDRKGKLISQHHVFALGAGKRWRKLKIRTLPHWPAYGMRGVCISGVLYYAASTDLHNPLGSLVIVGFDVRSEEFNFTKVPVEVDNTRFSEYAILINYKGKVAMVGYFSLPMQPGYFDVWILEDTQTGQWSNMSRFMPPRWRDIIQEKFLFFHATTHTGEIIMAHNGILSTPFYVFYYDLEKNSIRRVEIKNLPAVANFIGVRRDVWCCFDHLESIMSLENCSFPGIAPVTLQQ